jgi:hypothetical protein
LSGALWTRAADFSGFAAMAEEMMRGALSAARAARGEFHSTARPTGMACGYAALKKIP